MHSTSSASLGSALAQIYDVVLRRSPAQPEFHQAVREVLETIGPVVADHPEYMRQKLVERICEPERQSDVRAALAGGISTAVV
jgi:glutamate dehydrogenase (NADP+)